MRQSEPSDSGGTPPVSPRQLRVSDTEREYVVGILQQATGKGLIDLEGFSARADTAYAAGTREELNAVLTDLPDLVHREAPPASAVRSRAATSAATGSQSGPLELSAHYSNLNRNGQWHVPERVLVRNRYGSTKLDFTEARVDSPVVHVELDISWGSALFIIPEHAAVDAGGVTHLKFGSLEDKTASTGKNGTPLLVLSGRVHGGSLTIRHPKRGWFC